MAASVKGDVWQVGWNFLNFFHVCVVANENAGTLGTLGTLAGRSTDRRSRERSVSGNDPWNDPRNALWNAYCEHAY
jgi:hypothetical protein